MNKKTSFSLIATKLKFLVLNLLDIYNQIPARPLLLAVARFALLEYWRTIKPRHGYLYKKQTTKQVIINIFIISSFLLPQNVINCHILQILTGEKPASVCVCDSVNESNMGPFTPFSQKISRDYVTIRSGHMINSTDEKCKNFDTHFMNFNFMNVTQHGKWWVSSVEVNAYENISLHLVMY